jgi:hypothetical protein
MTPIETKAQIISLGADGILRAVCKHNAELHLTDAEDAIRQLAAFSNGIRYPVLVDLTGLKSISREARAYFSGPETAKVESAAALVVRSPMAKAIGNFFMGLNKGTIPACLFTSESTALEWLRRQPR